jgi:hypothetical protein
VLQTRRCRLNGEERLNLQCKVERIFDCYSTCKVGFVVSASDAQMIDGVISKDTRQVSKAVMAGANHAHYCAIHVALGTRTTTKVVHVFGGYAYIGVSLAKRVALIEYQWFCRATTPYGPLTGSTLRVDT